uniref:Uncharacterized protein n=1 Tax=Rhizophora mucronata TaxID=61149 RepID=A0A2P2Q957_RHIMU
MSPRMSSIFLPFML